MKFAVILATSFLFGLSLVACSQGVTELDPIEFRNKVKATKGAIVLDVRTPDEFSEGHLENAVNIDVKAADFEKKSGTLDKKKTLFVYCLAGTRSKRAALSLQQRGYKVIALRGGITAWQENKLPVRR